jgi:hypothetical protein
MNEGIQTAKLQVIELASVRMIAMNLQRFQGWNFYQVSLHIKAYNFDS